MTNVSIAATVFVMIFMTVMMTMMTLTDTLGRLGY